MHRFALGTILAVALATEASAATVTVDVLDFSYGPVNVIIQPGDTVEWTWQGNFLHSVTAAAGQSDAFDSGLQAAGTFQHTFNTPGVVNYYCTLHGNDVGGGQVNGMAGSVTIAAMSLTGPANPTPNANNTWTATGATPYQSVLFGYSLSAGSFNVPDCPGLVVGLNSPKLLGSAIADGTGVAFLQTFIPNAAAGRSPLIQAVDRTACTVSNIVQTNFP